MSSPLQTGLERVSLHYMCPMSGPGYRSLGQESFHLERCRSSGHGLSGNLLTRTGSLSHVLRPQCLVSSLLTELHSLAYLDEGS